jgi:uncharacterized protein (DUF302 family)
MENSIGFVVHVDEAYEQALEKVKAALKAEGFGVLTAIDVRATMKEKLGVDFRPYTILGACNPPLAHKALSADASVGLMLPCNVTVEDAAEGGSRVILADPRAMILTGPWSANPELVEVANEAHNRLKRAAEKLGE